MDSRGVSNGQPRCEQWACLLCARIVAGSCRRSELRLWVGGVDGSGLWVGGVDGSGLWVGGANGSGLWI